MCSFLPKPATLKLRATARHNEVKLFVVCTPSASLLLVYVPRLTHPLSCLILSGLVLSFVVQRHAAHEKVVGMLSVKDLLKEVTREKEEILTKVTDFKLGRGGFFEHT